MFLDQENAIGKLKEKVQELEDRLEKQENAIVSVSAKKPTIDPDLSVCFKTSLFMINIYICVCVYVCYICIHNNTVESR